MMHTIDRYFAPGDGSNAITDEIAEGLLRTVIASGRKLLIDQTNYDAMNPITKKLAADPAIRYALAEDITSEDVTTNAVLPEYRKANVQLICKEDGVIAGLSVFERVFQLLDENTEVQFEAKDGDDVKKGQRLAVVTGDARVLLSGERTALNFLQRMSGIATYTRRIASLLEGTGTTLLDTRKTTPGMLDNMTPEMMKEAVTLINGKALTECSGNITLDNVKTITETGVDYVSCGALTHSAPILDLSLKHLTLI